MKFEPKNIRIVNFHNNASSTIKKLSLEGKRSRYTGVLQFMIDHFEENYNSIQKNIRRLEEKYAKVDSDGCFVFRGDSNKYVYTKENRVLLENIEVVQVQSQH